MGVHVDFIIRWRHDALQLSLWKWLGKVSAVRRQSRWSDSAYRRADLSFVRGAAADWAGRSLPCPRKAKEISGEYHLSVNRYKAIGRWWLHPFRREPRTKFLFYGGKDNTFYQTSLPFFLLQEQLQEQFLSDCDFSVVRSWTMRCLMCYQWCCVHDMSTRRAGGSIVNKSPRPWSRGRMNTPPLIPSFWSRWSLNGSTVAQITHNGKYR
jgi:hypothetical protein